MNSCQAYLVLNEKIIDFDSSTTSKEEPLIEFSFLKQKEPHQLIGSDKNGGDK